MALTAAEEKELLLLLELEAQDKDIIAWVEGPGDNERERGADGICTAIGSCWIYTGTNPRNCV
jgi:hypothetical protein